MDVSHLHTLYKCSAFTYGATLRHVGKKANILHRPRYFCLRCSRRLFLYTVVIASSGESDPGNRGCDGSGQWNGSYGGSFPRASTWNGHWALHDRNRHGCHWRPSYWRVSDRCIWVEVNISRSCYCRCDRANAVFTNCKEYVPHCGTSIRR